MMLKRYLYEDVVNHSAPFPLIKFYIKNFNRILFLLVLFYVGCLYVAVKADMFKLNVIDPEDFFIESKNTTKEYKVYKQLIDQKSSLLLDSLISQPQVKMERRQLSSDDSLFPSTDEFGKEY